MKKQRPSAQFKGAYRVEVFSKGGVLLKDTGEFDNLLTDGVFSTSTPFLGDIYLCVGAGVVTAPTFSDTSLGNQIASKRQQNGMDYGEDFALIGDPSYPRTYKISQEFIFTGISGDLSELGIRDGSSTGTLMSRSLIRDESDNPTTVTVSSDMEVRITYSVYSIIPDPIISTGTLVTPHGTSDYTIYAGDSVAASGISGIHALEFNVPMKGYGSSPQFALMNNDTYTKNSGGYSSSSLSYTVDLPNKKTKALLRFTASTESYQFNRIVSCNYWTGSPQRAKQVPWIDLDTPITVPANYDVNFDIEFTWDRYDSGA